MNNGTTRSAHRVKGGQMKALVANALSRGFDFENVQIAAPIGREVLVNVCKRLACA
jgi:hypothetical protein